MRRRRRRRKRFPADRNATERDAACGNADPGRRDAVTQAYRNAGSYADADRCDAVTKADADGYAYAYCGANVNARAANADTRANCHPDAGSHGVADGDLLSG